MWFKIIGIKPEFRDKKRRDASEKFRYMFHHRSKVAGN